MTLRISSNFEARCNFDFGCILSMYELDDHQRTFPIKIILRFYSKLELSLSGTSPFFVIKDVRYWNFVSFLFSLPSFARIWFKKNSIGKYVCTNPQTALEKQENKNSKGRIPKGKGRNYFWSNLQQTSILEIKQIIHFMRVMHDEQKTKFY